MQLEGLKKLIKKHESGGFKKIGWFSLRNDGDEKTVRILGEGITEDGKVDLPIYEVHKVASIGRYGRNVKCKGENCPLCNAGHRKQLRMILPLYVEGEDPEIQVWDRGIVDIKKLLTIFEEYGQLNMRDFKIKRNGAKGSTNTTYEFFPRDLADKELPTIQESDILNPRSFYLLDLSDDLMELASEGRLTEEMLKAESNQEAEATIGKMAKLTDEEISNIPF